MISTLFTQDYRVGSEMCTTDNLHHYWFYEMNLFKFNYCVRHSSIIVLVLHAIFHIVSNYSFVVTVH